MAFAQNQVKPNSTPNYFNNKTLFNTTDNNISVKHYENIVKDKSNLVGNKNSDRNFFMNENEMSHDSDDQENSILINNSQQMNSDHKENQQHVYLSESKELVEINNRLGFYINAVNISFIRPNISGKFVFFVA